MNEAEMDREFEDILQKATDFTKRQSSHCLLGHTLSK
jgi:hypothetical protein